MEKNFCEARTSNAQPDQKKHEKKTIAYFRLLEPNRRPRKEKRKKDKRLFFSVADRPKSIHRVSLCAERLFAINWSQEHVN